MIAANSKGPARAMLIVLVHATARNSFCHDKPGSGRVHRLTTDDCGTPHVF